MVNAYLDFFTTILFLIGGGLIAVGGITVDGVLFDAAMRLLWIGIAALGGALVCQTLKRLH